MSKDRFSTQPKTKDLRQHLKAEPTPHQRDNPLFFCQVPNAVGDGVRALKSSKDTVIVFFGFTCFYLCRALVSVGVLLYVLASRAEEQASLK